MVAPLLIPVALEMARQFAPGMVKWLSGSDKAAEAAEKLVSVAQAVTGASSPEAALARLHADPNLVLQFNARSLEVDGALEQAYLADRQDARRMSVELAKVGTDDSTRKNAMIIGDVIGLIVCIAALIYIPELPGEVRGIISTIAGFFGLGLRDAHQFEFGSSRGSVDKTAMMARSARE